jgi:heme/copper-type cytochrome/quinol oxidase subunit 2
MKGRLTVEPRAEYEAWLERKYAEQEATQAAPVAAAPDAEE